MQYYITRNGQQLGPFTDAEVRSQLATGTLSPLDFVWWEGQPNWIPLGESPLAATAAAAIPAPVGALASPVAPVADGVIQPTSKLAIWALILGCLSLLCNLLTAIPAIVLGHMGMAETKKNPAIQGRGMAIAGMIIGYVITALTIGYFTVVAIVLASMGDQVKDVFKTINSQIAAAQAAQAANTNNSGDQSPADQSTNAPDQSTNAAPATTPDQSTNTPAPSPMTTPSATDSSTNAPSTNSSDSSTNAAPMSQ